MKLLTTITALLVFTVAIAQSKHDTNAANDAGRKGNTFYGLGKLDSAIFYYKKAIELDQDKTVMSGFSYAYIGQIYKQLGDVAQSTTYLNKAIALHTDKGSVDYAQSVLAWTLMEEKKYKEMATLCHKMISSGTAFPDPYIALGTGFQEQGVNDSARYYLQLGVKMDDDKTWKSAAGDIALAKVYISKGEKDKAKETLKKVIAMKTAENLVKYAQQMLDAVSKH